MMIVAVLSVMAGGVGEGGRKASWRGGMSSLSFSYFDYLFIPQLFINTKLLAK